MWFEEHGMLRDDPQILPRLQDFLSLVMSPDSLAAQAKDMLASLDRLVRHQLFFHTPVSLKIIFLVKYSEIPFAFSYVESNNSIEEATTESSQI